MQLQVGDKVRLANTLQLNREVAKGTVMEMGGQGLFHNRPISPQDVRVNLNSVLLNIPLLVPVEEADQVNIEDAVGSGVLWPRRLIILRE